MALVIMAHLKHSSGMLRHKRFFWVYGNIWYIRIHYIGVEAMLFFLENLLDLPNVSIRNVVKDQMRLAIKR